MTGPAPLPPRLRRQIGGLVFDTGAPIAVYYVLHGAGVSNLVALAAGAVLRRSAHSGSWPPGTGSTWLPCWCWPRWRGHW